MSCDPFDGAPASQSMIPAMAASTLQRAANTVGWEERESEDFGHGGQYDNSGVSSVHVGRPVDSQAV